MIQSIMINTIGYIVGVMVQRKERQTYLQMFLYYTDKNLINPLTTARAAGKTFKRTVRTRERLVAACSPIQGQIWRPFLP